MIPNCTLYMSSSELYQVANYGLAGQYIYHYDPV